MSKALEKLIQWCSTRNAMILRFTIDESSALVELWDGTPSGLIYKNGEWL